MYELPKAMTFDCYGTLIDWEGEIQRFFAQLLATRQRTDMTDMTAVDVRALQRHWEAVQFQYIQGTYQPYRQVLRHTMKVAFEDFKLPYSEEDVELFASSMGKWQPFPDTRAALNMLQKYMKIVLITNTDDAIIAETEQQLGITFDDSITAEQARAYKPSHTGFHMARQRLGLAVKDIWHAGFGFKYDVIPAHELGYTTVWVNRQGEARPVDVKETFLVGDMATLVLLVKGIAAG
jgi:2-haloacid dehalogenase